MMDCFFSHFFEGFLSDHKMSIKHEISNFYRINIVSEFRSVFIMYLNGCIHSLHIVFHRKTRSEH